MLALVLLHTPLRLGERVASQEALSEAVAFAVIEFITGPLLDNPRRLGAPLWDETAETSTGHSDKEPHSEVPDRSPRAAYVQPT